MSIFDPAPVRKLKDAEKAPHLYGTYSFQQKIHDFLLSSPADTQTNAFLTYNAMNRLAQSNMLSPLAFIGFAADMIKTYNCSNQISNALESHLTSVAGDLNKATPGQKPAFALLYSYFSDAYTPAQTSFATSAMEFLADQHPDQGMTPAFEMYEHIPNHTKAKGQALDYVMSYYREAVASQGIGATIDLLMTADEAAPDAFRTQKACETVAAIITADPNGVMDADRPAEWPINAALWAIKGYTDYTTARHTLVDLLAQHWLPAYGDQYGVANAARYFEPLMQDCFSTTARGAIVDYMAPRLDALAAVNGDIAPSITWARLIGAEHPEVMTFTTRNLTTLLMRPTNAFEELAKPLPTETLASFTSLLPREQRDRLQNFINPPQPYKRRGVHIVE